MIRNDALKKEKPTLGIIDAKSIKNADTAEEKGYDAHKKVSGIKLHIITPRKYNTIKSNKVIPKNHSAN